jgi:hypothetical protein
MEGRKRARRGARLGAVPEADEYSRIAGVVYRRMNAIYEIGRAEAIAVGGMQTPDVDIAQRSSLPRHRAARRRLMQIGSPMANAVVRSALELK